MDLQEITDERNYFVTKQNDLIQKANYKLTAAEQKFLCYVISKIKPTDREFQRYVISALDFAEVCGIDRKNVYRDFEKMIDSFNEKAKWIWIDGEKVNFRAFSEADYNPKQGSVTVMLHSKLKKYLMELKSNYTEYELWNVLSLKSKYSIRLYELFVSYRYFKGYGQYEKTFDLDELKSLLCAENYTLYANFKERVLEVAIEEINKYTDISASYDVVKSGRAHKVTDIRFKLELKEVSERVKAYHETVKKLNRKNKQIEGQLSLFDSLEESGSLI